MDLTSYEARREREHMELYTSLSETALTFFNSNQGTNFIFVKFVKKVAVFSPNSSIHLNFIATDNGGDGGGGGGGVGGDELPTQIFYAEIIRSFKMDGNGKLEGFDVRVVGCALLEKVDTGNPMGLLCNRCENTRVIHPGPRSSYRVVAGDKFESSQFMQYNLFSPGREIRIKRTIDHLPVYTSCANLALQRFNHNEESEFRVVKVLVGFFTANDALSKTTIHVNFLAERPEKFEEPMLFFAEAVTPKVMPKITQEWNPSDEKRIKVKGCCRLTKSDSGSVFGRVCEMCINGVIHPGPRDGYSIAAGDLFQDYKFMEIGNGIY